METTEMKPKTQVQPAVVITPEDLLEQWQGHRRLTRKVIDAFPEDKLYTYSIGEMRTFAQLAMEIITMSAPGIRGIATGKWQTMEDFLPSENYPKTKKELLLLWDDVTDQINEVWPTISPDRFQQEDIAFGQYKGTIYWILFYFIDNEIHHRGQGYVYLRSLGITPPFFWERE